MLWCSWVTDRLAAPQVLHAVPDATAIDKAPTIAASPGLAPGPMLGKPTVTATANTLGWNHAPKSDLMGAAGDTAPRTIEDPFDGSRAMVLPEPRPSGVNNDLIKAGSGQDSPKAASPGQRPNVVNGPQYNNPSEPSNPATVTPITQIGFGPLYSVPGQDPPHVPPRTQAPPTLETGRDSQVSIDRTMSEPSPDASALPYQHDTGVSKVQNPAGSQSANAPLGPGAGTFSQSSIEQQVSRV